MLFVGVTVGASPAAAEMCSHWVGAGTDNVRYVTEECATGAETEPAGGGEAATCYTGRQAVFGYEVAYCSGANSCYRFIPARAYPTPADWPARPAGIDETAIYANQACFSQPPAEALVSNEYLWVTPSEADIAAQVDVAFGQLVAPVFTLVFNPPGARSALLDGNMRPHRLRVQICSVVGPGRVGQA